jgi:hypothetical protein
MTDGKIKQARIFVAGVDGSEEEVTITGDFRIEKLQLLDAPSGPEIRWEIRDVQPEQVHSRTGEAVKFAFGANDFFIKGPMRSGGSLTLTNVPIPQRVYDAGAIDGSQIVTAPRPGPAFKVNDLISIPGENRPTKQQPKRLPSYWRVINVSWLVGAERWNYTVEDRQGVKRLNLLPDAVNAATLVEDWPYRGGDFVTVHTSRGTLCGGPYKLISRVVEGDNWQDDPEKGVMTAARLSALPGHQLWRVEDEQGNRSQEWSKFFRRAEVKVNKTVTWTTL